MRDFRLSIFSYYINRVQACNLNLYCFALFSTKIAVTHERVSKLEQAKEHWMLESQLLQVKYEKEVKVCLALLDGFQFMFFSKAKGC